MNTASSLLRLVEETLGLSLPIRLRAWDGSEAGVPGAPVVVIRNKRALRHIIWKPGELGVARAYVQGDLDIEGDLGDGLRAMWDAVRNARIADGSAGRPAHDRAEAGPQGCGTGPTPRSDRPTSTGSGRGVQPDRRAAQQGARPGRDLAPLRTCRTTSTS